MSEKNYVLHPKFVQFDVYFHADKTNPYYITTANNLVSIRNGEILMLGKLIAHDNSNFPLAIQSDGVKEFYISKTGSIVNTNAKPVGYLKLQ